MAIPVVHVATMPSLNFLSGHRSLEYWDDREDLHSYIRERFAQRGSDRYFGSKDDRYYQVFADVVGRHARNMKLAMGNIRDALADMSTDDIIRPCITQKSLRNLPPSMYEAVLSLPSLYYYFRRHRVQGWGELTPEDIEPKVRQYRRLIDFNGRLSMEPKDKEKEQKFHYTWTTDDPCLTAQQIYDIRRTREYVESILAETELDPTDLDEVRS